MAAPHSCGGGALHIPFEDLDVQDQVGGGGCALVFRGTWRGTTVAVKRWFDPSMQEEAQEEFRREALTMQQLRHPHVVLLLGACMRPPNLCLVTEYLPHSLHGVLYGQQGLALDRKRLLGMASDVARAFVYLHHALRPAVIHRDLKPSNCLVDRAWRVKVADFGLSANSKKQVAAGTPAYLAPELMTPGAPFSAKVDLFSFGVMLNEMVARTPPWGGTSPADIRRQVLAGARPLVDLSCPRPLAELIGACWAQQPERRPDFPAVLEALTGMMRQLG